MSINVNNNTNTSILDTFEKVCDYAKVFEMDSTYFYDIEDPDILFYMNVQKGEEYVIVYSPYEGEPVYIPRAMWGTSSFDTVGIEYKVVTTENVEITFDVNKADINEED